MDPLVTVITPAYNCESVLSKSIESVKSQSYTNWEHIIIDDYSIDNTRLIIDKFAGEDNRIKPIFLEANNGIANARNKGISAAKGKYIAFLDSDDLWKPEKLAKHINYMEKNYCDFTYSNYELINYDGKFIKNIIFNKKTVDYKELLNSNQIACLTTVIKSEIIKSVMMPNIKHEDYATWLSILKMHVKYAERLDGILASYRRTNGSASSNKLRTIPWTWKIYRRNQNLGFFKSLRQLIVFGFLTSMKYVKR